MKVHCVSGEDSFPGSWTAVFSVSSHGERDEGAMCLFSKVTNFILYDLVTFQRLHLRRPSSWGLCFNIRISSRQTQSMTRRRQKTRGSGVKDKDNEELEQKEESKRIWNGTQEKLIQTVLKAMRQDGERQDSKERKKNFESRTTSVFQGQRVKEQMWQRGNRWGGRMKARTVWHSRN